MTEGMTSLPTSLLIYLAIELMDMDRNVTAFRERFNAYKNGKSVSEIYDAGLPRYAGGKADPYENTIEFLKRYEGFKDTTYLDGNGIPTIGYGFTDSSLVSKGKISRADADRQLRREVEKREKFLSGLKNWDRINEDSKTALRSYYYNYPAGFKPSTKFIKAWNNGDYTEAIRQVDAGINDKKNPGLRTRRLQEQALLKADPFLQSVIPAPQIDYSVKPDATAVRRIVPAEKVTPAFDPTVSPYISGKPMLKLTPRVQLPNIIDLVEDSQWDPEYDIPQIALPQYKNGKSPIHINPANRGKFNATKKRTGKTTEQLAHSSNPLTRKRAIFALNAKKWKH